MILAIDPGYQESAYVVYSPAQPHIREHGIVSNADLLERIQWPDCEFMECAIEQIEGLGMAVGREVFETVWWTGRFYQAWVSKYGEERAYRVPRKTVKVHLCNSVRATDSNIRIALMDKFAKTNKEATGTKSTPGPLYGIKKHEWAALAVAVTVAETFPTSKT